LTLAPKLELGQEAEIVRNSTEPPQRLQTLISQLFSGGSAAISFCVSKLTAMTLPMSFTM
jgi:hypothetical protein